MTNDKLADEIEHSLRSSDLRDAGYAEPRIFIKASLAEQIIAALRRSEPRIGDAKMADLLEADGK